MDDLVLLTVGKLYLELTSYQRALDSQSKKIAELEAIINATVTKPSDKAK